MGRLVTTGPLPGCDIDYADNKVGDIERDAAQEVGVLDQSWVVEDIPSLTTSGTRRALVTGFEEFQVESVPISQHITEESTRAQKYKEQGGWHPDGACLRFRFTLPPGSYATILMREFMKNPTQYL